MTDRKLFLLDAYALIYRAYYALMNSVRLTSQGMNTSAIFGFVNTLDEVLRSHAPSHIAVCFDPCGPTFRHEMYPAYKAKRDKQPEAIAWSLPYIKEIVRGYGIRTVEVAGYEADDVIGTLARQAEREGYLTYMMTSDKDYAQLVTDRVLMYKPQPKGSGIDVLGPSEVCERFKVSAPSQVIDLLALEGDAVDNVPGCPGVGVKTAVELLSQYGSVETLLDHVGDLKGRLRANVENNVEQIRFSKKLVTICTDVPVGIDIEDLRMGVADNELLARIYTELEFRSFLMRLPASARQQAKQQPAPVPAPAPAPALVEGTMGSLFDEPALAPTDSEAALPDAPSSYDAGAVSYRTLTGQADVRKFVASIVAQSVGELGVACYAVGDSDMTSDWLGIAIAAGPCDAVYIEMPVMPTERRAMACELAPLFQGSATVVSHDVKREIMLLRREGVEFTADYYDTCIAHYLLEPEMDHSLARVASGIMGYTTIDFGDGRKLKKGEALVGGEEATRTCEMADVALRLRPLLQRRIEGGGLAHLMSDVELPLVRVLADMQWAGVRVDVAALAEQQRRFSAQLRTMEAEAYSLAGTVFNISSPRQVGEVLFDRLKIDPDAKRTKQGGYSTTEEILDKYRTAHPVVGLILDIRGLRKLLATYVEALPTLINPSTGKIHTTFNQTVASTGRISSANPNLQNIPVRTSDGKSIRRAFIADPGCIILSADYSQIELRVIADLSGDPDMIEAFASGADIHAATAAKIYHVGIDEVTPEQRSRAKTANFGIIYGISAFGLSQRLGIARSEAKELIDGYFRTYPHIQEYITTSKERARQLGYVTTIMDRKRYLPEINSRSAVVRGYAERNAVNAPIQGSAADIIKVAMVRVARHFRERGLRSRMIIQVHDELVFNVVPDELAVVKEIVTADMAGAYSGRVPLLVSCGTATNWLDAH